MTYPVTVYRWDDPGAPQITTSAGTADQYKNVLKKCLVEGYGSKAPLGWTIPFEDANGIVFQNNTAAGGSGGMVRFWPASNNWTTALSNSFSASLLMQTAKSFTASNAPFLPSQVNIHYHPSFAGGVHAWIIIGTAIGFYLISAPYHASTVNPTYMMATLNVTEVVHYIGDLVDTVANDAYRFVCVARNWTDDTGAASGTNNNGELNTTFSDFNDSVGGVRMYGADGSTTSARFAIRMPFSYNGGSGFTAAGQNDLGIYSGVYLTRDLQTQVPNTPTNVFPSLRGRVPGHGVTFMGDGGQITRWPYQRAIEGVNHYLMKITISSGFVSTKWINAVEW